MFAVGTAVFWITLVIAVIFLVGCAETTSHIWGILWTAVLIALLFPLLSKIPLHWLIGGFFGYFVLGGGWSLFKWKTYVDAKVKATSEEIKDFGVLSRFPRQGESEEECATRTREQRISTLKTEINPRFNKAKIYAWIGYWPFSLLWTCTGDLVGSVFSACSRWYATISSNAVLELEKGAK